MTVLFRQAWTWLQNWYEAAIVGSAVALFGLAYLLPLATQANTTAQTDVSLSDSQPTAFALGLYDVPEDEQFYRDKWIAEAAAFYRANPPEDQVTQAPPSKVIAASARTPVESVAGNLLSNSPIEPTNIDPTIVKANEVNVQSAKQATVISQARTQPLMALPPHAQRWRVATCLAAGLLASLLFVSIWPSSQLSQASSFANNRHLELVGRGEAIPVRIPTTWIGLRPTLRQSARRGVLNGSYLIAAVGAWGIVS